MNSSPSVTLVICANGLGHYRRSVAIISRLLERGGALSRITLVAERAGRERTSTWAPTERLRIAGADWVEGVMAKGVTWSTDPSLLQDGQFAAWPDHLREVPAVREADLVLSDNLAGVLSVRPDAVLAGSFLWSDVLEHRQPHHPDISMFVKQERSLLERYRPPMLCVGDMAMSGVLTGTDAVACGWMCEPPIRRTEPGTKIAVLGGRTGAADHILAAAGRQLLDRGHAVVAPADMHLDGAGAFTFEDTAWADVAIAVCRPGMGTLTDCTRWDIPVVAVREAGNLELDHNAGRIAALGIGVDPGPKPQAGEVAELAIELTNGTHRSVGSTVASQKRFGIDEAAEWLADRLGIDIADRSNEKVAP